jgi:hypothetical protein
VVEIRIIGALKTYARKLQHLDIVTEGRLHHLIRDLGGVGDLSGEGELVTQTLRCAPCAHRPPYTLA